MENQKAIILQQKAHYNALIATLTTDSGSVEKGLTIDSIIDRGTPLSVLVRVAEKKTVKQILDVHLTKLVVSFNLNLTLKDFQISQIIEDMIERYPNETIEDFIYVFKMARQNYYGQVFRIDSAVIFDWIEQHLKQKYAALEAKLYSEKDNPYKVEVKPYEFVPHRRPLPIDSDQAQKHLKEWMESVASIDTKAIVPISAKQIREEGKEVLKPKPWPVQRDEKAVRAMLHNEWVKLMFDKTGKKVEDFIPFEEWVKM